MILIWHIYLYVLIISGGTYRQYIFSEVSSVHGTYNTTQATGKHSLVGIA